MIPNTIEILVMPRKKILTGSGYVWEYNLAEQGWNELTCPDKYGIITGVFELSEFGVIVADVYWPALDITLHNIFPGELLIEET